MELGLINYRAVVPQAVELGFRGPFSAWSSTAATDSASVRPTVDYLQSLLPEPAGA